MKRSRILLETSPVDRWTAETFVGKTYDKGWRNGAKVRSAERNFALHTRPSRSAHAFPRALVCLPRTATVAVLQRGRHKFVHATRRYGFPQAGSVLSEQHLQLPLFPLHDCCRNTTEVNRPVSEPESRLLVVYNRQHAYWSDSESLERFVNHDYGPIWSQ